MRHARNLLGLGVSEIVVLSSRGASAEEAFSDSRIVVARQIPADCPPIAIVATDTSKHIAIARELVGAGAHVLIEKPIANENSHDIVLLAQEAESAGLCVRVAYNMRFLGAIRKVIQSVTENAIGQLAFARIEAGQWLPDWRPNRDYREGYSASSSRGGGVGLDLSHDLDYMLAIFGMPVTWKTLRTRTGMLKIASEDVFEGIYSYSNGGIVSVHLDYLEKAPRRVLRILGHDGSVECDLIGRRLTVDSVHGLSVFEDDQMFDMGGTYIAELTSFIAETQGGPHLLPTIEDGLNVLRLLNDSRKGASHV